MSTPKAFEVEIKTLLHSKEKADELRKKLQERDPALKLKGKNKQLNHYFIKGHPDKFLQNIADYIMLHELTELNGVFEKASAHSVRTRQADEDVIFVVKASVDDTTSSNGTARIEYEVKPKELSLRRLDFLLLDSDFEYQAKWSREREEYYYKEFNVSIDRNAGYGYLAEFERVLTNPNDIEPTKELIRKELKDLGLEELDQERLARMFEHYNKNWMNYYGTDKTFWIE